MKKQFIIKAAQALKDVAKSATKSESTSLLKFDSLATVCCAWNVEIAGQTKPVFSL